MVLAAALLAAPLAVCMAGQAMAQPLSPGGVSSGWATLSPGRAAGLFRARRVGGGGIVLVGLGAVASGGVALAMAGPDKAPGGQSAVISSTTGTTP